MADFVSVAGLEDFKRAVEELSRDLRQKVVLGAIRDALAPAKAAAIANSPFVTGTLRRNIVVARSKIYKGQGGLLGMYLGVRKIKARRVKGTKVRIRVKGQDPYYAKFLEAGFHHYGSGQFIQRAFLKPAGEATWHQSLDIFKARIGERIAKANRRK